MRVNVQRLTNEMCGKGIDQKKLAKGAGVSQTTVTSVMRKGTAKIKTVSKLASYLKREPGDLIMA